MQGGGGEFVERAPRLGPAVRILLLEDDPISVEIVGTYLRRIAIVESEMHSAASLLGALALLAHADVDLVVADLYLPDSSGAATIDSLVQVTGCPVIAITAGRDPGLRDATLACGAFEFLQKGDLTEATLMRLVRLATMQARTYRSLRESREAEAALRESEGRFRSLARLGQSAVVKSEPAELIEKAARAIFDALAPEAVAYVDMDPGTGELELRTLVAPAAPDARPAPVRCPPDSPILQVLASGQLLLTEGAALPFPWARDLDRVALAPVRTDDEVRGVLLVCSRPAAAFADEELNFLQATTNVLSTALQRFDSEAKLAYLAQFDPLTGLPNRALLADRFSQMIVQATRRDTPLAVLFIDLDQFKDVNDTMGHAGGDTLLKQVALRLQEAVRAGDTVARISGDEFAIVLTDLVRPEDAALVAQKIIDGLGMPVDVDGMEVFVTASVGIAAFPADGMEAETLIGAADAAMYRAKQSGGNAYQFFTAEINQRSRARVQLGAELRRALEREEFVLFYQPRYRLAGREPSGAEALLRWQHPERGVVFPNEFIPVLEETGLIVPVGEWAIRRACEDLKRWHAGGRGIGPVSVNLSARQFRQPDLHERIKLLVSASGVDPRLIEFEITESQLMQDPQHAIQVMRAVCDAGMSIAIDDFGTGYSSLAYLTRFPVSALKIDHSFVRNMSRDKNDATIVRTIIEMAHSLGFTVVAEGVETEEQATLLSLLRCEQAQGYLFGRPMPADDVFLLADAPSGKRKRTVRTTGIEVRGARPPWPADETPAGRNVQKAIPKRPLARDLD
jgi:diguanylate cyclase (GGDEF)-like protein